MKAFPASLINFVVQFLATIWLLNLMVAFLVCVIVTTPLNCNKKGTKQKAQLELIAMSANTVKAMV